ncbi:MAG TPA: undecaprenyl-diphosphate phosphatase [Solirubrobacterales bacterium]|nr:undecaprenyl-diphosphate phosphatase [Solirubrobacterales bacterium]
MRPSRAIVLGAVQGPTELLPVSSSAHLTLIPWFLGWRREDGDAEIEKTFGVALHAGAAAALLVSQRQVIFEELRSFDTRRAAVLGLSFLPPALFGVLFERLIERRLGGPVPTAAGLLVGAGAMVAADRTPQERDRGQATPADGLALGFAQAAALAPGISRNGATLSVARWRGFTRQHANMLSRTVALPVIVGAGLLKGARLRRRGLPPGQGSAFAAGTAASFASTLASQALIRVIERDSALWPYAAYRAGLAGVVLGRLWRRSRKRKAELRRFGQPVSFVEGNGRPAARNSAPTRSPGSGTASASRGESP